MQTPAGVAAAAGVSDAALDAIGVSKSALHAYGVDLEQQKQDMYEIIVKADAVARDAVAMYDLFKNPDRVHDLSICTLDSVLNTPGGFDVLTSYYLPVVSHLNAMNAGAPQQQQGPMMQQQMPQMQQQQMPPMMQQQIAPQQRSFSWGDQLASRQAFPDMPMQAPSQVGPTLEQIPPHERFKAIDSGAFF